MTIFNNNIKNSKDIVADSLTITNGNAKGFIPMTDDNGMIDFITPNSLSTLPFVNGVSMNDIERGNAWLQSNNKDEASKLQSLINDEQGELTRLGIDLETGTLNILVESPTGLLYINDRVTIPRNVNVEFKCKVAFGYAGQISMAGLSSMIPANRTRSPYFTTTYPVGTNTFIINANGQNLTSWIPNDLIRFRDEDEETGSDNIINSLTNNGNGTWTLVTRYPLIDFSVTATDFVRKYSASYLTSVANRGASSVTVANGANFTEGMIVSIRDTRRVGDIVASSPSNVTNSSGSRFWYSRNTCRYETRTVIRVTGNTLYFESPLTYNYDSPSEAYVTALKPVEHSHINGLTAFLVEDGTLPRNNRHILFVNLAVNCSVNDLIFTDMFQSISLSNQFPNINTVLRVDKSYMCHFNNITIQRHNAKWSSSSIGYGSALFLNSFCRFNNMLMQTLRHNLTLSGTNSSHFTNLTIKNSLGTALDLHGCGEDDNIFENVYVDSQSIQQTLTSNNTTPDATRKALIQLGNPTHCAGSSFNKFQNISLKWGNPVESNVGNVFGIDVIGKSEGNIFKDIIIENVDIAVSLYDFARNRLNSNLYVNDTLYDGLIVKNCNRICDISGSRQFQNGFSYQTGTMQGYNSNTFVVSSNNISNNMSSFNNIFNNWVCTINTSNYTVSNYNAINQTVTLTSNITPSLTSNTTYILQDSLTTTIRPIDGVHFNNCTFLNTQRGMSTTDIKNLKITDCYFGRTTTSNFPTTIQLFGVSNADVIMNNVSDVHNFIRIQNSSNLRIVGNKIFSQINSNILTDLGNNSNVIYNDNDPIGFTATHDVSSTTVYNRINEFYGYSNNPANIALVVSTSNGGVGIGTSNINAQLQFNNATGNRKIVLNQTQNNEHQYFGFGINSSILRYQVGSPSASHVFFSSLNSNSSREILRISGGGTLGINGGTNSNTMLHVLNTNATNPFINFDNSNVVASGSNINNDNHGSYYGRVKVNIQGVGEKWLALYD
jgi:hypothetical protein